MCLSRLFRLGSSFAVTMTIVGAGLVIENSSFANAQERVLSDGVYTDAQASRGRRVYRQSCASCHAQSLEGGEMGPVLVGEPFLGPWDGESLGEMMAFVQATMPQDNPGGLSQDDYFDVLAYMLQVNMFPAGEEALTTESLEEIVIESGH